MPCFFSFVPSLHDIYQSFLYIVTLPFLPLLEASNFVLGCNKVYRTSLFSALLLSLQQWLQVIHTNGIYSTYSISLIPWSVLFFCHYDCSISLGPLCAGMHERILKPRLFLRTYIQDLKSLQKSVFQKFQYLTWNTVSSCSKLSWDVKSRDVSLNLCMKMSVINKQLTQISKVICIDLHFYRLEGATE